MKFKLVPVRATSGSGRPRVHGFRPSGGGAIVPFHRRPPPEFHNLLCHPVGTRPRYEGESGGGVGAPPGTRLSALGGRRDRTIPPASAPRVFKPPLSSRRDPSALRGGSGWGVGMRHAWGRGQFTASKRLTNPQIQPPPRPRRSRPVLNSKKIPQIVHRSRFFEISDLPTRKTGNPAAKKPYVLYCGSCAQPPIFAIAIPNAPRIKET